MRRFLSLLSLTLLVTIANAQSPPKAELTPNVRVAIVGDSIHGTAAVQPLHRQLSRGVLP